MPSRMQKPATTTPEFSLPKTAVSTPMNRIANATSSRLRTTMARK